MAENNMSYFIIVGLVAIVGIVAMAMMVSSNKASVSTPTTPDSDVLVVDENGNMVGNLAWSGVWNWPWGRETTRNDAWMGIDGSGGGSGSSNVDCDPKKCPSTRVGTNYYFGCCVNNRCGYQHYESSECKASPTPPSGSGSEPDDGRDGYCPSAVDKCTHDFAGDRYCRDLDPDCTQCGLFQNNIAGTTMVSTRCV